MQIYIYTPAQILRIGLRLLKVDPKKLSKQSHKSKIEDFKGHYGTEPRVLAQMWEDLQLLLDDPLIASRPDNLNSGANLKNFLRAAHFLMRYHTEVERKVASGNTKKTVRKWTWFFLEKIVELKEHKIVWPDSWSTNFIISLDGVHCRFPDPKHPTLSKDPSFYSHKSNGPGLTYELALALYEPKLVWLKGPLPAGANADLPMYQAELKQKIPNGKVAITDGGYGDHGDPKLAQPNSHDTNQLRTFKARARMRQEAFHRRVKKFNCLTNEFRHGMERHGNCFVSCSIIACYEMEMITPMWDV